MTRVITGVQMHHTASYRPMAAHLSNAQQYAHGMAERTTIEAEAAELLDIAAILLEQNRRIWQLEQRSRARLRTFHLVYPQQFRDAADGRRPWHDENDDVELRCTCHDLCLHRLGVEPGEAGVCNCEGVKRPCPRHGAAVQP